MNATEVPADAAPTPQTTASDPNVSAWVSANAGSGKTYVLVQRVVRLLLDGAQPSKILCLTFTKAAAANMANRVFERLASWIGLDDAALDRALWEMEGRRPSPKRRQQARRLFAEALETPGGLKVQTIHAFCTALLHQFPFEAGVAAHFDVLEERAQAELIAQLRTAVLLDAAKHPDSALGDALTTAMQLAADATFTDVLAEAIGKRGAFEGWVRRAGGVAPALAELSALLGIGPGETVTDIEAEFRRSPHVPPNEWPQLMEIFGQGSATEIEHVERLRKAAEGHSWAHTESYLRVFCTQTLEPRSKMATAALQRKYPDLYERLLQEQQRVCGLLTRRRAALTRDRTKALLTIAHDMLARYRAEKNRRGVLDYDDLIEKTLGLLSHDGSAAWVMYKLDLGIDHVLIDEAQDTSPQQWEVIRRLTAEFTAGAGARANVRRSIFAVGDEKQSIYSFQGAAPHRFDEMRRAYSREHAASGLAFQPVPLLRSFRSSPDVLAAVDAVFAREEAYAGLTSAAEHTVHEAVRRTAPGFVEIWPLVQPEKREPIEAWDAPFDTISETSPRVKLARRIAATARAWIASGEIVGDGDKARPVAPGDVLVLVRQRGPLFEAIIRALKEAQLPVAGADRLVLGEHIAVMDLISLAEALLLRDDELSLAEALKSPLFGFDDDDLFALAHGRRGTLWDALRARGGERPHWQAAAAMLDELAGKATMLSPFAFYSELLGAAGGRRKILARLGAEANDALDEFLALALDYERQHVATLQGFIAWLAAAQAEVKRDMDIVRDEVRVMTVHGAKGLEAPVVILADTVTPPRGSHPPRLLPLTEDATQDEQARPIVWAGRKDDDSALLERARTRALAAIEDEHRRLLYVAMTRAADRLIVCGAQGRNKPPAGCWFALVHDALAETAEKLGANESNSGWRWRRPGATPELPQPLARGAAGQAPDEIPAWLHSQVAEAVAEERAVSPSRARAKAAPRDPQAAARARARGTAVHRLLQSLPAVAPGEREAVTRRFLAHRAGDLPNAEQEEIVRQIRALLAGPAFGEIFAPSARAEVPIVGRVPLAGGKSKPVAGQIDRLAVTASGVLIADFKTDRVPARAWQEVPAAYVTQLALYRAVLRQIYPDRPVRAALVFTANGTLVECPPEALDAALTEMS